MALSSKKIQDLFQELNKLLLARYKVRQELHTAESLIQMESIKANFMVDIDEKIRANGDPQLIKLRTELKQDNFGPSESFDYDGNHAKIKELKDKCGQLDSDIFGHMLQSGLDKKIYIGLLKMSHY